MGMAKRRKINPLQWRDENPINKKIGQGALPIMSPDSGPQKDFEDFYQCGHSNL